MLASHGWNPRLSQRRGFTVVQAHRETLPPVVVALHDPTRFVDLMEAALDEAMTRSVHLVALDLGQVSLHDRLWRSQDIGPEDLRLKALVSSPHVRVVRSDVSDRGADSILTYCESHETALLVVSADFLADAVTSPSLRSRIFSERFDLLVVTHHG